MNSEHEIQKEIKIKRRSNITHFDSTLSNIIGLIIANIIPQSSFVFRCW